MEAVIWVFCFGNSCRHLLYEISRSATLAWAMASLAAVMCSTLLSEPFLPSSVYRAISLCQWGGNQSGTYDQSLQVGDSLNNLLFQARQDLSSLLQCRVLFPC
jgi:hypothetical protein